MFLLGYEKPLSPNIVILCRGQSGFFHCISHFPLCSPWLFPVLPITQCADSCKTHFTVSMAHPLPVRFSQWEQLAWYLEGGKRGEAWCFSFLSTSDFISCHGCTCNVVLPHNNCLFFPAPTRNHPLSFHFPPCGSGSPSSFLSPSITRNTPAFCFDHLCAVFFLLLSFGLSNCLINIFLY